jgi:hypothetical protein
MPRNARRGAVRQTGIGHDGSDAFAVDAVRFEAPAAASRIRFLVSCLWSLA